APTYYSPYGPNKYAKINLSEDEILRLRIRSEQDLLNYNSEFLDKGLLGKTYVFGEPGLPIYIKGRADIVLDRMKELGYIGQEEVEAALKEAETKEFLTPKDNTVGIHFVLYVRELLEQKYGKDIIERGGLKITTTLDLDLQRAAEKAAGRYAEDNANRLGANNSALLALNPENGHILAMMGSRDYWNDEIDGKVNMVFRPRLPGSSFKPFVYAAAFLKGYAPATVLYDVSTKFGDEYQPGNFDGTYLGPIPIRKALAYSRNIPAVKAAYMAGLSNVIELARSLGVGLNQPDDWYGLSLAIGAGEVKLIDMVRGYSAFANGGYKVDPVAILKVEDKNGNILEEYEPPAVRPLVLDPQVAYLINNVLSDASARPEGFWRDVLTIPGQINAAKTGTSNKKKPNATPETDDDNVPFDGWTLGYTRRLVAGVWAGNAGGSPLKLQGDGLNAAGKIWKDFMVAATRGKPAEPFDKPEGIRYVDISVRSGKLPSEFTPENEITTEVFASFSAPTEEDDSYQVVEIDKVSGKLATEFTPEPAREKKAFYRHHSEFPTNPQWEDPVRLWAQENGQEEEPPTTYDDVHTAKSEGVKPDIRIISPTPGTTVALPYVGVVVDIDSAGGVAQVDYYWDDERVSTVKTSPWRGSLTIPIAENPLGSSHVLKAVVFDSLYNSNQASAEVRIGEDAVPPQVHFIYPTAGSNVSAGSVMAAQVDAYDSNGDIKKVEWYWGDQLQDTTSAAPYVWAFTAPKTPGAHVLKAIAYDFAGNTAQAELTLNITSQNFEELSGSTRLLQPSRNQTFDQGEVVVVKAYLDSASRANLKTLSVYAKPEKGNPFLIAQSSEQTDSPFYTFLWPAPSAGRYELFLKVMLKNGEVQFSERVPVVVR
ncbi:MAG: penicillin-binding transpeptidase domain-containing protein, partial [Candidatus Peregrinibacteria bacterium]